MSAGSGVVAAGERLGLFRGLAGLFKGPATHLTAAGTRGGARQARRSLRAGRGGPGGRGKARAYLSRVLTKDPIDVASGEVVLRQIDVELAGALPLVLERTYLSSSRVDGLFGRSWASTLDQRLEIDADGVCFASADGMVLTYPTPAAGTPVLPDAGPRWPLCMTDDGDYTITDPPTGREWRFTGRPGTVLPLTSIADRNGHRIELVHDDGALSEVRHSGGYRIAVAMEGERVAAFRLVTGHGDEIPLVRYRYDDAGRLSEVINSSGLPLRFGYDDAGRLAGWVDRNGFWYRYGYDEQGRAVRAEGSGGLLNVTLRYAEDGSATTVTDSAGHATTFQLNESGRVVAEVDPLGRRTLSEWDDQDRLVARTDPLGRTTRYAFDDRGDLISIIGPGERRLSARYDEFGLPVECVEANGAVWRREYDGRGNMVAVTDPLDGLTRCSYDDRGRLTAITDALGRTTRVTLDAAGLAVAATDPGGATTRMRRDAFGRVTAIEDATGGVTRFGWTIEGRPAWRTLPGGATERWRYDPEGNCVEYRDAEGHLTRTEYGPFDKPVARVGPDGARLEFSYDTELRLVAVTNPIGLVWRYEYNGSGDLVRETDFNGRTVAYAHDAAGRVTTRVNGAGQATHFAHDVFDNVVEQRSGDTVATFTYDLAGRLIRAVNPDADVRFDRDALGRIIAETCNGRTLTSAYDLMGRRVHRRTPSGAEAVWRYDVAGRPADLRTAGQTIGFAHDAAGREVERRIGGNAVLAQRWDADRRLSSQTLWGTGGDRPSQHRAYRYRADGTLIGTADRLGGPASFELDLAGRVTAVHADGRRERYAYDPAGNLIGADTGTGHDAAGPREHAGVRVRRAGRTHYSYDEQGRVTVRRRVTPSGKSLSWEYVWDADDRLIAVTTPDGRRWRYRYDALGRRIAKQLLAQDGRTVEEQTDFVWDGPVLAEQVQSERVTTWDYAPDTFRPLAQTEGVLGAGSPQQRIDRRFYAIVTDLIGTPAEFVTADGAVAGRLRTTLWGAPIAGGPVDCPLRFPGQYHDAETGLHYNFQRYYDPAEGRYQSPDPLGLAPAPDPYAYAVNPTLRIDPLGLAPCEPERHLALGLKNEMFTGRPLLQPFSERVGAYNFFDKPADWWHGSNEETVLHLLKDPKTKVSFNMTGVHDPYEAFLRVARNRGNIGNGAGFTDWELYQVSMHPETWSKITFYKDGSVIGNPFEMSGGRLAHPLV